RSLVWFGHQGIATVPQNAPYVVYTDEHGQLLDTLPVCQDFNRKLCNRPACKFVHLQEGHVEVVDMKVMVCRDAVTGKCGRPLCKYYHIPIALPPANEMAAQLENKGQFSISPSAAIVAAAAAAAGQLRTSVTVSSGNPNSMLCQQVFGFNS
ncbi:muscleblind-like protein 1, partial [Zootermopsis nevadensis]|uniref:muscleblind-like protein 1 n=1 Tax=Zootermopsis nevadensis TaxID=136037 RepID=UPI000B8EB74D